MLVDTWRYKGACSPTHNLMEEKNWGEMSSGHEAAPREKKEVAHLERYGNDSRDVFILGRVEILQMNPRNCVEDAVCPKVSLDWCSSKRAWPVAAEYGTRKRERQCH